MAESHGQPPDTGTAFTVFDYLGLGCILEPLAVVARAMMPSEPLRWSMVVYGLPFLIIGGIFIYIGRNWGRIKSTRHGGFVKIVDSLSRSYVALFLILLFILGGILVLPILLWPPEASNQTVPAASPAHTLQDPEVSKLHDLVIAQIKVRWIDGKLNEFDHAVKLYEKSEGNKDNWNVNIFTLQPDVLASQDLNNILTIAKQVLHKDFYNSRGTIYGDSFDVFTMEGITDQIRKEIMTERAKYEAIIDRTAEK
jgi:hypothetical protein